MPSSTTSTTSCDSRSSASTAASSMGDEYEQFTSIQKGGDELVRRLILENKESKLFLSAWRVRCETLEMEVARLAGLLESLEASRREDSRREVKAPAEEIKVSPFSTLECWGEGGADFRDSFAAHFPFDRSSS